MNKLISHRGPDGDGKWIHDQNHIGLAHRRLAIIDLSDHAAQPMHGENNNTISYNGEIYNYKELMHSLSGDWNFRSQLTLKSFLHLIKSLDLSA